MFGFGSKKKEQPHKATGFLPGAISKLEADEQERKNHKSTAGLMRAIPKLEA